MIYSIYKLTCIITGKSYIGYTKNPKHRWYIHKYVGSNNRKPHHPLYQAIQYYGWNNFIKEILYQSTSKKWTLKIIEPLLIKEHDTLFPNGYNLHRGGGKFPVFSGSKNPTYHQRKNIPMSEWFSPIQLQNHKKAMIKRHSGKKNIHAQKWKLISPQNQSYIIHGQLAKFCKEQKLSFSRIYNYHDTGIIGIPGPKARNVTQKTLNCLGWQVFRLAR